MGIFSNVFKKIKLIFSTSFYDYQTAKSAPWSADAWEHDIVRGIVDCIATHAAKGKLQHVIIGDDGRVKEIKRNSRICQLMNERPNDVMSGFELKYRFFAQLETKTTAVLYMAWNAAENELDAIYPVDFNSYELRKVNDGSWAILFMDREGSETVLPLEDLVIARKFYHTRQAAGDGNAPIYKILDMAKASDEGFIEALSVSNKIRGLVKQRKAILDPKDVKKGQDEFAERFNAAAKNGGIVAVDSMEDFTPLTINAFSANAAQMKEITNRLFNYFRTPEEIVQSKYNEQQGLAWYESKIEPVWQQLAEALNNAYFTPREKGCGNKLVISGGVLMGTSYQTRINIIDKTKEPGILTINEQRELLGYEPVEGGDVRQTSLNYVKAQNQDQYQIGKGEKEDGKDPEEQSDNEEL